MHMHRSNMLFNQRLLTGDTRMETALLLAMWTLLPLHFVGVGGEDEIPSLPQALHANFTFSSNPHGLYARYAEFKGHIWMDVEKGMAREASLHELYACKLS